MSALSSNPHSRNSERITPDLVTLSSTPDPFWAPVIVRLATSGDRHSLDVLAQLDSAPDPVTPGEAVIGELQGRVIAAVSLRDGRAMADPFVAAEEVLALVRMRAGQLAGKASPQGSRRRTHRR